MYYAKVDEENRIIDWSEDKLDGLNVEFSNGQYINEVEINGVHDFVIINGEAVFNPTEESIYIAKKRSFDPYETSSNLTDAVFELGEMASNQQVTNEEIMDAVIELAGIIASMQEGE